MRQILTNAVIEYFQRKTLKRTLKIRSNRGGGAVG